MAVTYLALTAKQNPVPSRQCLPRPSLQPVSESRGTHRPPTAGKGQNESRALSPGLELQPRPADVRGGSQNSCRQSPSAFRVLVPRNREEGAAASLPGRRAT